MSRLPRDARALLIAFVVTALCWLTLGCAAFALRAAMAGGGQ